MSSEKTLPKSKHANDRASLDKGALQQNQEPSFAFSSTAERRLVRKIDFMLLPIMTFAYMMAFMDKQALSYTAIMGLRTDLKLKGAEYSWAGSIFYFGYLFFSYPASLLLVKFPLGRVDGICGGVPSFLEGKDDLILGDFLIPSGAKRAQRSLPKPCRVNLAPMGLATQVPTKTIPSSPHTDRSNTSIRIQQHADYVVPVKAGRIQCVKRHED